MDITRVIILKESFDDKLLLEIVFEIIYVKNMHSIKTLGRDSPYYVL